MVSKSILGLPRGFSRLTLMWTFGSSYVGTSKPSSRLLSTASILFSESKDDSEFWEKRRASNLERLSHYYSPQMMKAIVAAEEAVTENMFKEREPAKTMFPLSYVDDLSKREEFYDFINSPIKPFSSSNKSDIPKLTATTEFEATDQTEGTIKQNLYINHKLSPDYINKLLVRPLVVKYVSNVTRLGKIRSYYCLTVVGDQNGMVGIAEGKDRESVSNAVTKSKWKAIKNMVYIPRLNKRTIYGNLKKSYHGVDVELWSRPAGFGLRANHLVYEVCRCAGIRDIAGKVRGSRNKMNTVKAAWLMLQDQVMPHDIALARGKKLVDVQKVYFGH
ncbi:ribosomal protein S5, N-terminal domain-containing protein [Dipodascopsis uninucleata]